MRKNLSNLKTCIAALVATICGVQLNAQTPDLEFAPGVGNPTGNGPSIANQVITFQNNSNNPSGNTFVTYNPTLTATFSLSNQQYSMPTSQISTGKGMAFGANASNSSITSPAAKLFDQMGFISAPSNGLFTSSTSVTAGTGIDISANYSVIVFVSAKALENAGASTGGRYYFGDITINFNQTVTNPIIQLVGMGGYYRSLGFTSELELQTPGIVLSKVSGTSEFNVSSGTKIVNTALHPSSASGSGAASGSVLATGSGISTLSFKVYMRGDGNDNSWSGSGDHQGDVFMISVSVNAPVDLSGTVYDDAKGLTDNKVDGVGIGSASGSQLYANLLNTSGTVLNSVPVNNDGTFTFSNVASLTSYEVQVSTNQGTKAQAAPATALPSGWLNTGENLGNGVGNDGNVNGRLSVTVASSIMKNANLAIENAPESDTKWYAIPTPIANSFMILTGIGTLPGSLTGTDLEDGLLGAAKKVGITSLPTGGNQLWYNGVQITKGADGVNAPSTANPYIVPSYVLAVLSIKFTGVGSNQTVFNYAYFDAANVMDGTPATYTINWASVLPLKLLSFIATVKDNHADLNWTTATEDNLSHFVIEKSDDGKNFTQAGVVFAKGNTTEKSNYEFLDDKTTAKQAVVYYRLRSVDRDGKVEYSETRVVRFGNDNPQTVTVLSYPNPATNELKITIPTSWQSKQVKYELISNNGQSVIKSESMNSSQTETINVSKLAPGFYVARISCGNEVAQQKIIKQ